jgi:DNA-binding response OmpR family regulator
MRRNIPEWWWQREPIISARATLDPPRPRAETATTVQADSILVVDDEAIVLDVLKVALKKAGFTVFTATRMLEATALVHGQRFACALIDKNLPDGSGLELIKLIRQKQPECTCLVMTAYPNADSILEALKLGAVDYLEKPFPHVSIIQEKVKAAVDRQRRLATLSARVAEMHAQQLLAEPGEEGQLQSRLDALQFRYQRVLALLREVKSGLEGGDPAAARAVLGKVSALLEELK